MKHAVIAFIAALFLSSIARAQDEPPTIPIGLDAYRMWDQWPLQHIGERAYMRSTYDRTGGNEGADASHFLYQTADDFNVTLDIEGPGLLCFARYNHWHGSPWHYVVDGVDHIVTETSTADPKKPAADSVFEPREALPNPLTWTWSTTKGADLMWVPIGFEKSFQMAYGRTHYGTGYYIFKKFVPGTNVTRPIAAWNTKARVDDEILKTIETVSGDEWEPSGNLTAFNRDEIRRHETRTLAELNGPAVIRSLEVSLPAANAAEHASQLRLRITWDQRADASVDAPLALFFGAGTLYNRDGREFLVKSFPMTVRFRGERVELRCRFPMPFFKHAKIELVNGGEAVTDVACLITSTPLQTPVNHVGYFHATYRDHPAPEPGRDLVLLNTRKTEGGGDWSGTLVGTSFIFSHNAVLTTLEGDPRFYFDGAQSPQCYGTGTEEWGGGGDYWGGRNMTLPLAGHPVGAPSAKEAKNDHDKTESAYRFLLADSMPFGRDARITLEHGGVNESIEHYETVTYWYGLPATSLAETDQLIVTDEASERAHSYSSPEASPPYEITSRYEWGVDKLRGQEIFRALTQKGRVTKGSSQFVMKLRPDNFGVMLRRTLDYQYAHQRGEVFVADASNGTANLDFKPAGVWYLAGSNACVYSNPKDELGAVEHKVQTSNRRFREDEFLIPRELTRGRSAIAIRIKFVSVARPIHPGGPTQPAGWSEISYTVNCFVMPKFP